MNNALTAGADSRPQATRLMRRVVLGYLCVMLLAALALAGALLVGWRAAKKELALIDSAWQLRSYSEQYMHYTCGDPATAFAPIQLRAVADEWSFGVPMNPYSGKACVEYQRGSDKYFGNFSYLLVLDRGYLTNAAIVVYSPMPSVAQRRYYQLFRRPASHFDPDLRRAGPDLVWIGGEIGTNYLALARGLSPADAIAELNRRYKAACLNDTDDLREELIFMTPEEYAAKQSKTPQAGAGDQKPAFPAASTP